MIDRLVEYNLSQVEAKQSENFIDFSKKIIHCGNLLFFMIKDANRQTGR